MKMKKTIFKVGDRVFSYDNGWGTVYDIDTTRKYSIFVEFDNGGNMSYTHDGKRLEDEPKTLSFTEYTLQGFSQERPITLPEVGEWCLVRDKNSDNWKVKKFIEPVDGEFHVRDIDNQYSHIYQEMKRIKILD
jgi:hypothetical protein